jgi:hypothetical protein
MGGPSGILKQERKRPKSAYQKVPRVQPSNRNLGSHSPIAGAASGVNFSPYQVPNVGKLGNKQVSFSGNRPKELPTSLGGMDYLRQNDGRASPLRTKSPRRIE